jgi:hypothetical protein
MLFYVLFVCKCVLYYCHRVAIQLQLTNISYHHIKLYHILSCNVVSHRIILYNIIYHIIFLTSALDGGVWSPPYPGSITPAKENRYPLNRRLCRAQSLCGCSGGTKVSSARIRTPNRSACNPVPISVTLYWPQDKYFKCASVRTGIVTTGTLECSRMGHFHVPITAVRRARVPTSAFVFSILVAITGRKLIIPNKHSDWLRRIFF